LGEGLDTSPLGKFKSVGRRRNQIKKKNWLATWEEKKKEKREGEVTAGNNVDAEKRSLKEGAGEKDSM